MRMIRIAAAVAAVCLLGTPRAGAGIYSNDPLDQIVAGPLSLPQFQNVLGVYLSATSPQMPTHQRYLSRIKELEAQERGPFGLSTDDRVTLSAAYLRVLQPEKAAQVLKPVEGERNFMVHANLATAHQMSGRLERAADYQEMALKEWPSTWPGMTQNQLSWFYRTEKYYQALLRARLREERLAPGKPPETLDEVFPGVRFVGSDDKYQAGSIAPLQQARLPADALPVVQQLVLWLPTDERLSWLLAEVLNANGFIAEAWGILDSLSNRGYSPRELKEHRQVLKEAVPAALAWSTKMAVNDEFLKLLWAVSPRGGAAPGSSPALNEIGWAVGLGFIRTPQKAMDRAEDVSPVPSRDTPRVDNAWLPSLRHVIVSFLAGVALTLLAGMQVREMRRRREGAAAKG
jgi:hypothetical protein